MEADGANSTTQVQTSLAEGSDNHYNGMAILFYSGNEAYQMRRIFNYTGGTSVVE